MASKVVWCACTPCKKTGNSRSGVAGCLIPAHSKTKHVENEQLFSLFSRVVSGDNKDTHAGPQIIAPVPNVAQQIGNTPQVTDRQVSVHPKNRGKD